MKPPREIVLSFLGEELRGRSRLRSALLSWPAAAMVVIAVQVGLSSLSKPHPTLSTVTLIPYFLLLVLATAVASVNALQRTLGQRAFWAFLAAGFALWALDSWFWIYYELILHQKIPDSSIADPVLFLHAVPFLAALAARPESGPASLRGHQSTLNFLLVLFVWVFLYAFLVLPFQFLPGNSTLYNLRYNLLYFAENLALIATLGLLIFRAQPPWKSLYWHLLGAASVYATGSLAANTAIDLGGYYPGHWTDYAILIAFCWFASVPLRARRLKAATTTKVRSGAVGLQATTVLAMLMVLLIPVAGAWELFQTEDWWMHRFRLLAALCFMTLLALAAFLKRYAENRGLKGQVFTSDQMRRALIEASPAPIVTMDPEGKVRRWNGAAERIFGWTESEVLGRPLPSVSMDELEGYLALRAHSLSGQGINGVEARCRRKDGAPYRLDPLHRPPSRPRRQGDRSRRGDARHHRAQAGGGGAARE